MRKLLATASALLTLSSPALAEPFTYAPEHCEFKMAFPEKPFIEQKCSGTDKKVCVEVVSFAKVVSAEASVNFRVTCQKLDAKELARYTPDVMKETLKGLLADANMESENIQVTERSEFTSASAVSIGTRGERDIMYTGQIWVGKSSLLTIEGDMTGPQDDKADVLFSDILKSMNPKNAPAAKPVAEEAPSTEETPAEE